MFSFFRRQKPTSLNLFEREPVAPNVAVVESAVGEPEEEKLAVVDSEPGNLPPALPEPDDLVEEKTSPELPVETGRDSESLAAENLSEKPIVTAGDNTSERSIASGEVVVAKDPSAAQTSAERASTEAEGELESPAAEDLPEESVTEETLSAEPDTADAFPSEDTTTDSLFAETDADVVSIEQVTSVVTGIESSSSAHVAPDLAHRLAVLEDTVRQEAFVAHSEPKRRWWCFWRKPHPVEESVIGGELSAIDSPKVEAVNENSAPEEIAAAGQAAASQLPAAESSDSVASGEAALAEAPSATQTSAERASTEAEGELECPSVQDMPEEPDIGQEADAAKEPVAIEEAVTEETVPAESDVADALQGKDAATESLVVEAGGEIFSIEPSALDVSEIESSNAERPDFELADGRRATVEAPPETSHAAPSKPKRRWWSFWRKPYPVEQSVAAGELSVIDNPVVEVVNENSGPEEIAAAEQAAAPQLPATESKDVDAWRAETIVGESSASENPTEIPSLESDVPDLTEIELQADILVTHEAAEIESRPDAALASGDAGIEPAAVEPLLENMPAIEAALEISAPKPQADEIIGVGNAPTPEEFAVLENAQIESAANEREQIVLSLDPAIIESAGMEAAADLGDAEIPLTESGDSVSVSQNSIPESAITNPTAPESEINAGATSSEILTPEADISIPVQDDSESESPVAREEEVPANISEVREMSRSGVQLSEQSNQSAGELGLLDLPRVAEPEVMEDSEEVAAYSSATSQAWLDKIDDSFVEHAARLVKGRQRGRALDIGTGPGHIALKLALRLSLWKVIGVDRSQKMIDEALAKLAAAAPVTGRLEFRVADGNHLDFPNATFDLVICNSVLHHFAEPRNLLAELARVTKPRGAILLRDLRRPSRLKYPIHVRWHGRHYDGAMEKLYRDSVRAAYTVPELQRLLDTSPLRGARVFRHGSTHIGIERPYNW